MDKIRYEYYKKYAVQADSVDDYLKRYTNYNNFAQEIAPHNERVKSCQEEIEAYGFCYMTKYMSITGQPVTYYPELQIIRNYKGDE